MKKLVLFFLLSSLLISCNKSTPHTISTNKEWDRILEQSAFGKLGMDRLNNPKFQYQTIGLGGTTMRVDPWGFASHRAPYTDQNSYNHKPSFGYEYWWDNTGHRYNPFLINAGYGPSFDPGTITAFEQNLDIRTGVLETELKLTIGEITFTSSRETFITPEGVLVIRVNDKGAPLPIQLNLAINENVEWFGAYYTGEEDPFSRDAVHTTNRSSGATGGVVAVNRPNTSGCAVAVAVEATSAETVSGNSDIYSQTSANGTITFYIVPKSSFNPGTPTAPWDHAWSAASIAKNTGYASLKQQTADWWRAFLNISKIFVPNDTVSKLFAQSLYYHGIYFGNTAIPPGCFGTDIYGFFGAVCPEYDLSFSSFALAYTGHIAEAKNIADWVYAVLPKCKEQATEGLRHHDVFRKYDDGAIYTTLMGYDGALTVQGEPFEGCNLNQNIPGANAALMAITYLDFSDDDTFREAAYDILKSTTYVSLEDLFYDSACEAYRSKYSLDEIGGSTRYSSQMASTLMGYKECVKRGIAEPEWEKYRDKILIPTTILNGDTLISGGVGAIPEEGVGDAPWLQYIWWDGVVSKHDPLVRPSYENTAKSNTGNYVFNNGWMGVIAAKLYLGNDALSWLKKFQRPEVLLDETSFAENTSPVGFNYTPEIGAHGAYICNLTQMLLDPDDDQFIDIFPAIPDAWEYQKIAFSDLLVKGALSVSAERDSFGVKVNLTNNSMSGQKRKIRIKIPKLLFVDGIDISEIQDGFVVNNLSLMPGESKNYEYTFSSINNN